MSVRWCGLCHEPVREFAPRPAVHPGGVVGDVRHRRRGSRWRDGPTVLGPLGRILATAAVVLLGPWTVSFFALLYAPAWILLSVLVLKQIWQPQGLDADAPPTWSERLKARFPLLWIRLDDRLLVIGAVLVLAISSLVLGTRGRFLLFALAWLVALVAVLAWLSGF